MGCGGSVAAKSQEPVKVDEAPAPLEKPADDKAKVVDSENTTATPPADDVAPADIDEAAKKPKEDENPATDPTLNDADAEAAAVKIQSIQKGKQARKEVAALKAEKDGAADKPEEANVTQEPALTEEEAAKQDPTLNDAESEAAAVKIQAMHKGKQARKEVAAMKDAKGEATTDEAAEAAPAEDAPAASAESVPTDETPEEKAAREKAEEEAAALKIQSRQRAKQAKKEVDAMREEAANAKSDGDAQVVVNEL